MCTMLMPSSSPGSMPVTNISQAEVYAQLKVLTGKPLLLLTWHGVSEQTGALLPFCSLQLRRTIMIMQRSAVE